MTRKNCETRASDTEANQRTTKLTSARNLCRKNNQEAHESASKNKATTVLHTKCQKLNHKANKPTTNCALHIHKHSTKYSNFRNHKNSDTNLPISCVKKNKTTQNKRQNPIQIISKQKQCKKQRKITQKSIQIENTDPKRTWPEVQHGEKSQNQNFLF